MKDTTEILDTSKDKITRRGFLRSLSRSMILVFLLPFAYAIYKLFEPPKFVPHSKRKAFYDPKIIRAVIPIEKLPVNSSLYTTLDGERILIVRKSENDILAFSAICTHKNCTVNFRRDVKDIFCDCHESSFNLDGFPLNGPAKEPLPRYKTTIESENVVVTFQ